MTWIQPADVEKAKSKLLVKAADNALNDRIQTQLKNLEDQHERDIYDKNWRSPQCN